MKIWDSKEIHFKEIQMIWVFILKHRRNMFLSKCIRKKPVINVSVLVNGSKGFKKDNGIYFRDVKDIFNTMIFSENQWSIEYCAYLLDV